MNELKKLWCKLDKVVLFVPFLLIIILCTLFVTFPDMTNNIMNVVKPIFGDKFSLVYLFVNFFMFIMSFYLAFSKYGKIVLGGKNDKPAFSFWGWGAMMFCCGMGGDVLYYSSTEWINYTKEPYVISLGDPFNMANCYSIFFWANFWFYLVLAVCFAFMIHVRKVTRQKYSESLRPILGKQIDGPVGKIIDIFVLFIIIAAVTCSLCFTIPIIPNCLSKMFGVGVSKYQTILVLIIVCIIYSISVFNGLKGIKFLSNICIYVYLVLLGIIFIFGGEIQYILESTFKQFGLFLNNLIFMFTDIDPLRKSTFVQDYCAFYDAYWLTWAITVPYFIAVISKGKTVKETILQGYMFGVPGSILGFLIIGNFGMSQQLLGKIDFYQIYEQTGSMYEVITSTLSQIPLGIFPLIIMTISMICFCATSFDSMTLTCCYFSYKNMQNGEEPAKSLRLFWAISLILLPIVFTFAETSYENLQNVAVLAGFIAAIIVVLVLFSFMKDANKYLKNE